MSNFEKLPLALSEKMQSEKLNGNFIKTAFDGSLATRRNENEEQPSVWNSAFSQDINKILYCPYYNRCTDKTQVFSLFKNDDITRRSLHVQLVSRIARTIGSALNLNLELIEAIALGHDIGHTPFAHTGEKYLDELYFEHAGKHFAHNVHSVRVLDKIYPYNLTLQVLNGIVSHNGECELEEYHPTTLSGFEEFDEQIEKCYLDSKYCLQLMPTTLEGCVVRISDIIAYLGKDRLDAVNTKILSENAFDGRNVATDNAELINNLVVNVIENSYGKPYIKMDTRHFNMLKEIKATNYKIIYNNTAKTSKLDTTVKPMMRDIYEKLLKDLKENNKTSPIFTHHIAYINKSGLYRDRPYEQTEKNQIVVDYIASMTDDYFIDLHHFLFPDSKYKIEYKGYFD